MTALTPFLITGYTKGLQNYQKPFLLPDQAWSILENEYVWRERLLKREGNHFLGRLQRSFSNVSFFVSDASPWTFNILDVSGYVSAVTKANPGVVTTTYAHGLSNGDKVVFSNVGGMTQLNGNTYTIIVVSPTSFSIGVDTSGFSNYTSGGFWISNRLLSASGSTGIIVESNAQIAPGSVTITIGSGPGIIFTDNGNGTLSSTTPSNSGTINYVTGSVTLTTTAAPSTATTISFGYYPGLPGMGIWQIDQSTVNEQITIWWDQKYAYIYTNGSFHEFIPGTDWSGIDSQFFWAYNYQSVSGSRILYVTNFNVNDPMYFTDSNTWTPFKPAITASTFLLQARILIPYYGRLIALNTWEGANVAGATNFFNRCRFSRYNSDPTASDAWRSDQFGKGGFIDAPTGEQIIGATVIKNTLVVDFEYSTWQLRYLGEYGTPFIWERVSADYGSGSTFSGVLFDNERLVVGDVAITTSNAINVNRIDLDIPDQVFDFQNDQNNLGALRIWGVRNYQKEVVYWCYPDANTQAADNVPTIYPNRILLYNYRNKTFAIFRDSATCFGTYQLGADEVVSWIDQIITWDDEEITWDDDINQQGFPQIVKLNQEGFAHMLCAQTMDDPSLSISAIALSSGILQLTIPNHNLAFGETIYLTGIDFIDGSGNPVTTSLNNTIFLVEQVVDVNTIQIAYYNMNQIPPGYVTVGTNAGNWPFTPTLSGVTYVGNGVVTLFPKPNLITKDINLYQSKGMATKLSRIDFLMEPQPNQTAVTANLILNSAANLTANINLYANTARSPTNYPIQTPTSLTPGDPVDYFWFSFYQTLSAQYFRIQLTYSDVLMNTLTTHQSNLTLYAINAWTRPGGRLYAGGV